MIYPDYPLAQELKILFKSGVADFERYLKSILYFPSENIIEASQHGLFIFSKNEDALEKPIKTLNDIFHDAFESSLPQVRYFCNDNKLYEPVMHLRLSVHNRFAEDVELDLLRRYVNVLEKEKINNENIFRGEAQLRNLIGYKKHLESITDQSSYYLSWLDRYSVWRPN